MLFLIYSETNDRSVKNNLGKPEYSYYFVLKEFKKVLEKIGKVVVVFDPESEVDRLYDESLERGERCVFLSFSPPHKTAVDLRCPTIPVFAWEYDTIPNEVWEDDIKNDWSYVLKKLGQAITHSNHTVNAVKKELGEDFPIISIPSPVWEAFEDIRIKYPAELEMTKKVDLVVRGRVIDSSNCAFKDSAKKDDFKVNENFVKGFKYRLGATKRHFLEWYRDVIKDLLPVKVSSGLSSLVRRAYSQGQIIVNNDFSPQQEIGFSLSGVVYTSVFNPYDGRKNWHDMVTAFCAAFVDKPDAVLVLKFTCVNSDWAFMELRQQIEKCPKHLCRIVGIHGYLEQHSYEQLIAASNFAVNSSVGEGQCLPLMEFMACGKPAVSPAHTAMSDYIDSNVAFIVDSADEPACWPHDPRFVYRAHKQRVNWSSLKDAFSKSYKVVKEDPSLYLDMSSKSIERISRHASQAEAISRINSFINF